MLERQDGPNHELEKNHESLDDTDIAQMLCAFGNHEGKALTLLAMESGVSYGKHDLYRGIMEMQGNLPGWSLNKNSPFAWCESSLSKYGFVTESSSEGFEGTRKFHLEESSAQTAKAFAALLLDWSYRNLEISLNDLFGTSQPGPYLDLEQVTSTSPYRRFLILNKIITSKNQLKTKNIAKIMGLPSSTVGSYLKKLSESGVILYDSTETSGPRFKYRFNPDFQQHQEVEYPTKRIGSKLPNAIRDFLTIHRDRDWTQEEIAAMLFAQGRTNSNALRHNIGRVLKLLENANIVNVVGNYSEIDMEDETSKSVAELISIITSFQENDYDTHAKGNNLAFSIIQDPNQVSKLMEKAQESSQFNSRLPLEETMDRLIQLVHDFPSSSTRDIQIEYIKRHGQLGISHIRYMLNLASGEHKLIQTNVEKTSYWNVE